MNEQELPGEEWRAVPSLPDYQVSTLGRVRRAISRTCGKEGKILKPAIRNGYPAIDVYDAATKTKRLRSVHRLIAETFIGPADGREVNHIDGVRTNNALSNLEYTDRSGNALHSYQTGLQNAVGERNGQAKLTEAQVEEILLMPRHRGQPQQIARHYGVSDTTIRDIWYGRVWGHVAERMRREGRL